jgi:hypothetical protein
MQKSPASAGLFVLLRMPRASVGNERGEGG